MPTEKSYNRVNLTRQPCKFFIESSKLCRHDYFLTLCNVQPSNVTSHCRKFKYFSAIKHLQAKFLGSQSARQKILHVMRKFLPFQADFCLIMRYAHTHADNFFMRMCATSRITTQSHENYIAAFILDLRLHMPQLLNSQNEYLLRKPILSHTTRVFGITKPMPHCPCE